MHENEDLLLQAMYCIYVFSDSIYCKYFCVFLLFLVCRLWMRKIENEFPIQKTSQFSCFIFSIICLALFCLFGVDHIFCSFIFPFFSGIKSFGDRLQCIMLCILNEFIEWNRLLYLLLHIVGSGNNGFGIRTK